MSELATRITEDVKGAMRAGDKARLSVLRMLQAELKQREVVESTQLTDAVVQAAVEKMVKQRRDSENQFRNGNRPDLADKEASEIEVLIGYLPQQLSDAEVAALLDQAIAETGASGGKDMGKVMGWIKPKAQGRTDMGKLSGLIKARLG
ncbi:GatB/YqeY domain-containing protein [Sinimarinibacterium sp. CAU 1509]|uniref:GatB/YqeY domain-containing protein n=1 Tax=Sinimarinibacterium sp. CAU 1509 TaxID=2562283 RepID=UPI0010AC62FE|nr:GatB/YqeY domain-containing protein [Sinimarinibacterium sp. CAU 1509]TJY59882.1 GatB/YqeY domain-containing protein [Sinimarinibacterium sp. CAU 1509]